MKAVILAGGLGTRLSEETTAIPKPMVAIGGRPILWHIMKRYHNYGVREFVICLGYKGYVVKEYFANYALHSADVTIDLTTGDLTFHRRRAEPWQVTLIDTGDTSNTGGRLGRVKDQIFETFMVTYGDGLADIDIGASLAFHRQHGRQATMTVVTPPGRFGAVRLDGRQVRSFAEKPAGDGGLISGGFFIFEPDILSLVTGDESILEEDVLPVLAENGELMAYQHAGFWQPMDTLRDKRQLEAMWLSGHAPWQASDA
ncbi:MAG: glucose-1-phosphate cytidylyltransferase [Candidatus Nanopelagicales bacterium]